VSWHPVHRVLDERVVLWPTAGALVDPPRGGPLGGSSVSELLVGVFCVGITAFPCVDVRNGRHVLAAEGRVGWGTCWRWVLVAVTIEYHR